MSWQETINKDTAVWRGVVEYAQERMGELTALCVAPESTETQIRQAQSGILELQRLLALPQQISAGAQLRAQATARKEY